MVPQIDLYNQIKN